MEIAPVSPPPQSLLERLKDYGQEDAFALWDELSSEEKDLLVKDIEVIFFFSRSPFFSIWDFLIELSLKIVSFNWVYFRLCLECELPDKLEFWCCISSRYCELLSFFSPNFG